MSTKKKANGFDLSAGVPEIDGEMRPKPKFADRISKRVLAVGAAFTGIIAIIFLFSLDNMDAKKEKKPTDKKQVEVDLGKERAVPKDVLGIDAESATTDTPQSPSLARPSAIENPTPVIPVKFAEKGKLPDGVVVPPLGGTGQIPSGMGADQHRPLPPPTPEQLMEIQAVQERLSRTKAARVGGLQGKAFGAQEAGGLTGQPNAALADALISASKAGMPGAGGGQAPATEQDQKIAFLNEAKKARSSYHSQIALPAISPNEVKIGSFIPMSLETGINSDMPGEITARVSEAVYDTITGCRVLIPPMTKVIGSYDSKVALGQGRVLAVWNTMVFPDGSELNLGGMQAYDVSGQAGLKSDVDNHYMRLIGLTFGMSMITAGAQLSVPQPNPTTQGAAAPQTASQQVATALAQQYGQLGAQVIGKYLAVQPTLQNFPGERFVVMVPRTVIFTKVWRTRCSN